MSRCAGLAGACGWWLTKEHNRPYLLVVFLLGRGDEQLELFPIVRGSDPAGLAHTRTLLSRNGRRPPMIHNKYGKCNQKYFTTRSYTICNRGCEGICQGSFGEVWSFFFRSSVPDF